MTPLVVFLGAAWLFCAVGLAITALAESRDR